jgi:chorismate dehydratase
MAEVKALRISVVSYLNSKPFINGLKKAQFNRSIEIIEDIPSVCAEKLLTGKAEIGLVPVAALPSLKKHRIISDYCIGADGEVSSVLLLSDVPLDEIKTILLDYQSRTSVMLTRVLAKNHWKISPAWEKTSEGYEAKINSGIAGVVIGDRALLLKNKFKYAYDLSQEWKNLTGLPFVFACWVSNCELESKFLTDFNEALKDGLKRIPEISELEKSSVLSAEVIRDYLTHSIDFNLNEEKRQALKLFLKMADELNMAEISKA